MTKRKILFLGETYRADAITWMNGLKEFGDFEMITWELKTPNRSLFCRFIRIRVLHWLITSKKNNKTTATRYGNR